MPKLQEATGGHAFDPVVGKYWECVPNLSTDTVADAYLSAWVERDSFKSNNIH
jgi:hypothetical protein